jgi:hypothetical protein
MHSGIVNLDPSRKVKNEYVETAIRLGTNGADSIAPSVELARLAANPPAAVPDTDAAIAVAPTDAFVKKFRLLSGDMF